jgi:hypothetical protein
MNDYGLLNLHLILIFYIYKIIIVIFDIILIGKAAAQINN